MSEWNDYAETMPILRQQKPVFRENAAPSQNPQNCIRDVRHLPLLR